MTSCTEEEYRNVTEKRRSIPIQSRTQSADAQLNSYPRYEKGIGDPENSERGSGGMRDGDLGTALLGFNGEAVIYCNGISDSVAHEYALGYARMIEDREKGLLPELPRMPHGLFEPNRNLICATLEQMCKKHFSSK
jgi:hypothetical protein